MKKKLIILSAFSLVCTILIFSSIHDNKSLLKTILFNVEALSSGDGEDFNMVVTGERTYYYAWAEEGEWQTLSVVVNGEIVVGGYQDHEFNEFYCCGQGEDDCVIFAPDRHPWLCMRWTKGVKWWLGYTEVGH